MRLGMLESRPCPFCGAPLERECGVGRTVEGKLCSGVFSCSCAAHPAVDGIGFMRTGVLTDRMLKRVGHDDVVSRSTPLRRGTDHLEVGRLR
jgi:hypothetical protein